MRLLLVALVFLLSSLAGADEIEFDFAQLEVVQFQGFSSTRFLLDDEPLITLDPSFKGIAFELHAILGNGSSNGRVEYALSFAGNLLQQANLLASYGSLPPNSEVGAGTEFALSSFSFYTPTPATLSILVYDGGNQLLGSHTGALNIVEPVPEPATALLLVPAVLLSSALRRRKA